MQQSDTQQRDAGIRYRFGQIMVEGAKALTAEQIIKVAQMKSNAVARQGTIDLAAERIRRAYVNRGHIRAKIEVKPDYKADPAGEKDGIVDIAISIEEGPTFIVRRLEFVGNETTNDYLVARQVVLRIGKPYDESLLEKSLQRFNSLGRFEKITKNNVEINVNEQNKIVDLIFHLKEKAQRR